MQKNFLKIKKKNGSALAYGLVIMFAISIILVSLLQFVVSQMKFSLWTEEKEQSLQIAEAGIYYYRWYLAHATNNFSTAQLDNFWATGNPLGTNAGGYTAVFPTGDPIGKYNIQVTPPQANSTIFTVKATGWTDKNPNLKRVVQVRFRRPSWSEYAVATNADDIRFGEGTVINGKIHSNGGIRFDGLAQNLVTSSLGSYPDPDHCEGTISAGVCSLKKDEFGVHTHRNIPPATGTNDTFRPLEAPTNSVPTRSDVFAVGRQLAVAPIPFGGYSADDIFLKTQAQTGVSGSGCAAAGTGCYFDNTGSGRQIVLKTDGTFDMCTANAYDTSAYSITNYKGIITGATGSSAGTNGQTCTTTACCSSTSTCDWINSSKHSQGKCVSMNNYTIPNGGIIFVENNAWVQGQINNKKITIVASNNSEMNPTTNGKNIFIGGDNLSYTNYDGRDIIGLVAQKDVSVIENSLTTLNIDGALLAQNGRVGRESYAGIYKTSITLNGAMATNLRYGFAYAGTTHSCGGGVTIANGYCSRTLNFDNNLLYFPPPYFPTTGAYAIDLWTEL